MQPPASWSHIRIRHYFLPSIPWTRFTTNVCPGTSTPYLEAARTTAPLMVSTSVRLPSLKSARMDVHP